MPVVGAGHKKLNNLDLNQQSGILQRSNTPFKGTIHRDLRRAKIVSLGRYPYNDEPLRVFFP